MKLSNLDLIPESFKRYVSLNQEADLQIALKDSLTILESNETRLLEKLADKTYATGKWTIKEMLQHIIDTERIMAYRALRFARLDKTPLAGFEENDYAAASQANSRLFPSILDELIQTRKSSILLFESFSDDMLLRSGIANGKEISVIALGYTISGHQIHHFQIIKERYLPLLKR